MRTAMMLLLLVACLPAGAQPLNGQVPRPDAYGDASAEELVRLARERRSMVDRRIERYQTTAQERLSVGLRAGFAERLLFRRETASRIDWSRDTVRIDVLGSREVLPSFTDRVQVPDDVRSYAPALAFDPLHSEMLLRFDSGVIRHPLSTGSEAHYRFSTGDTAVIRLPDGRTVRLRELRVQPRRSDPQLVSGSFWLEVETHAVVQAFFRMARGYDSQRDGGSSVVSMRGEVDFIAIDYGLWDMRWWLPRSVVAHGVAQFGAFRMPMRFERRYDDYTVVGDTLGAPVVHDAGGIPPRACRPPVDMMVNVSTAAEPTDEEFEQRLQQGDSARLARQERSRARRAAQRDSAQAAGEAVPDTAARCERTFIVTNAARSELLVNELLPGSIYSDEAGFVPSAELEEIMRRARSLPRAPWQLATPALQWRPTAPGLWRFNRVEGLSVAVRSALELGPVAADAEARVSTEGEFGGRVGVHRDGFRTRAGVAAYRRLDVVDVSPGAFGIGSTVAALLLGRDDNDYFRATGAELTLRPAPARTQWYDLRLFAERQASVETGTRFTARRLVDADRTMRPNITADGADQFGAALRLRRTLGLDPAAPRVTAEVEALGETGDFSFVRPAARVRASTPLLRGLELTLDGAGGSAFGDVSAQRLWQIGGSGSLRGYDAAAMRGDTYWRGTAEVGLGLPLARFAVFSDIGWAGDRADVRTARPLNSVGAGVAVIDGLLRFDVARGLDNRAWRVHFRMGG